MKQTVIQENLSLVQNTLERWLSFKKYLVVSFTDQALNTEDEANFLEIKSSVARNIRTLSERIKEVGAGLDYGEKTIRDLLNKCVSVMHLRGLPVNDRRQIYKEWHSAFVKLSRTVGALKFMSEGYVPTTNVSGKKKPGGGGGGGSSKTIIIVVVVVLLIALGIGGALFMGLISF